eukprot:m.178393 g.178393  ORF g.178393 m.178393 type:complete len:99 (+) comp18385_c0_seq16:6029-6325(+)
MVSIAHQYLCSTHTQVVTGAPLLKNANDVASYDAEQLLRNWTGLTTDHIQDLKRAQGEEASASVVNLLKWMLDVRQQCHRSVSCTQFHHFSNLWSTDV